MDNFIPRFWRRHVPATIPTHEMQYLIKDHLGQILDLDARSCTYHDEDIDLDVVHPHAWTQQALLTFIKQRQPPTHGYVVMLPDKPKKVVAYMAYELLEQEIHLLAFVVDPDYRGRGLGMAMLLKLQKAILQSPTRKTVAIHVREHDDASIGFFRKLRFRSRLVRSHFEDGEDGIRFWYTERKTIAEEQGDY